jgi:hypothetical protein
MNNQHILAFVEAIHRTDFDAVHVFTTDAIVSDDIGQVDLQAGGRVVKRSGTGNSSTFQGLKLRRFSAVGKICPFHAVVFLSGGPLPVRDYPIHRRSF